MNVKHKINMDLTGPAGIQRIDMVERDQYVRQLEFVLTCGETPWTIPEDVHAVICFVKADGTGGEYDALEDGQPAWSVEGNVLTVDVAPQVLTSAGVVMLAVDMLRGNGKISTFTVMLNVQEAIPLDLESGDYFKFGGFLSAPKTVEVGQLFRVAGVNEYGVVTELGGLTLEAVLDQALAQARDSGEFDGPSAYEVAVENGFEGTEAEWLESLQGVDCRFAETAELGDIQQINVTGKLTSDSSIIIHFHGSRVQGVKDPVEDTDAANKAYADQAAKKASRPYQVPDHWQDAVDAVVDKITAYQDAGGRNCLTFALVSDTHITSEDKNPNAGHTGNLIAAVMDRCGVPFAILCGDAAGNKEDSEAEVRECIAAAQERLEPIGWQRLLQAQGVCDGCWEGGQLSGNALYGALFRKLTGDPWRVFGGDGSWYYLDYPAAKVRFILLNSAWIDETQADVSARTESFGYGAEQLTWLAETALQFSEEGWAIVLASHVPPVPELEPAVRDEAVLRGILTAFLSGSSYSGTSGTEGEWDYVSVSCDFSGKTRAEIIGFFSGYLHEDRITAENLPYAVVTVTCDADLSEDGDEGVRLEDTDTEHAMDFVTVNRETKQVCITRLGLGSDRFYNYDGGPCVQYTVAFALTNCSCDCSAGLVEEWDYFETNLTADSGYTLSAVTVTMGGADITETAYADGTVTIEEVTGNVVITAVAKA